MGRNPIILALDFPSLEEADNMLKQVRPHIGMIKVGLEMFTANGWECLKLAEEYNVPIFLDLKLYDIPTTVAKTVEVVCRKLHSLSGDHFLSVHCLGAKEMLCKSLDVASGSNVKIAGVTFLSSFDYKELGEVGYRDTRVGNQTYDLAEMAKHCRGKTNSDGIDCFICAPPQLDSMRKHFGEDVVLITPGIRAEDAPEDDHKRAKPASFALKHRANWIVVGRPITQAPNPEMQAKMFADVAAANYRY